MIDRKAFRSLSSGLYVISGIDEDGRPCACVVNTLLQVSSDPSQLLVSLNKKNATTHAVAKLDRFCASVLSKQATMELIGTFGFQSSYDIDKFEDVAHVYTDSGIPYLTECTLAVFEVKVDTVVDVNTHFVFIGTVEAAQVLEEGTPLTYAYYHQVLRGKTPARAATYNGGDDTENASEVDASETQAGKVGWRCRICGCVIEGYPDGLPDDFVCPMCKMPCSSFERIAL